MSFDPLAILATLSSLRNQQFVNERFDEQNRRRDSRNVLDEALRLRESGIAPGGDLLAELLAGDRRTFEGVSGARDIAESRAAAQGEFERSLEAALSGVAGRASIGQAAPVVRVPFARPEMTAEQLRGEDLLRAQVDRAENTALRSGLSPEEIARGLSQLQAARESTLEGSRVAGIQAGRERGADLALEAAKAGGVLGEVFRETNPSSAERAALSSISQAKRRNDKRPNASQFGAALKAARSRMARELRESGNDPSVAAGLVAVEAGKLASRFSPEDAQFIAESALAGAAEKIANPSARLTSAKVKALFAASRGKETPEQRKLLDEIRAIDPLTAFGRDVTKEALRDIGSPAPPSAGSASPPTGTPRTETRGARTKRLRAEFRADPASRGLEIVEADPEGNLLVRDPETGRRFIYR